MSIASIARAQARRLLGEPSDEERSVMPLGPREGWISVFALATMMVLIGLAIDDSRWAGLIPRSPNSQTGFLPFVAIFSVLLGIGLAKSRLSKLAGYTIAILIGAGTLLMSVSSAISLSPSIEGRLHDLNLSVASFAHYVFVLGQRSEETSVFLLLLGAVLWGAGIFCGFVVFRYHRLAPAILLSGVILLVNVSVTIHDQYLYLVAFAIAALLLIVRLNVLQQVHSWRLLDMGDLGEISTAFMRNGAVFVVVAIVASTFLAANASSAPLSRMWYSANDQLIELGSLVSHWLGGVSGPARGPNILFTPTQTIRTVWQASNSLVFTATTSNQQGYRWRGATYDYFNGRDWQQRDLTGYTRPAGVSIVDGTADAPFSVAGTEQVTATVTPANYGDDEYVSPGSPIQVDQPSEALTSGTDGPFVEGRLTSGIMPGEKYTVTAVVDRLSGPGALTANELAAAGTGYPNWVRQYYLEIRPGTIGQVTTDQAHALVASLPVDQRDPYHIAMLFQDYLYRTGGFQYKTDVTGQCGDNQPLVDCFLVTKAGFCQWFATAMVMMLRAVDIPARYAVGYLPGQQQDDGSWRVEGGAAHAWVEVYFPGYGWVEFDPTPGNSENGQQPAQFQQGARVSSPLPTANPSTGPVDSNCIDPADPTCLRRNLLPPPPPPPSGPPDLTFLVILAALLVGGGGAFYLLFRRVRLAGPEAAFDGVARLARRLGYGPRPAQTTYEYAESLSELVPVARGDLQLIALAKVEAVYARREPSDSLLGSLARAYRRVRIGLLRLVLRRRPHVPGPRPPEKI